MGIKGLTLQPVFYDSTSEKESKPPEKPKRTKGEGETATQTEKYKKNITKEKKMKQERYRIIKVKDELLFHLKMGNEEPTRRKRMWLAVLRLCVSDRTTCASALCLSWDGIWNKISRIKKAQILRSPSITFCHWGDFDSFSSFVSSTRLGIHCLTNKGQSLLFSFIFQRSKNKR